MCIITHEIKVRLIDKIIKTWVKCGSSKIQLHSVVISNPKTERETIGKSFEEKKCYKVNWNGNICHSSIYQWMSVRIGFLISHQHKISKPNS